LSGTNKLIIRCAWEGSSAFASAGYNTTTWAPGSCASLQPPSSPPSRPPPSPPSPPPAGTRLSIGAATTEQKTRLNEAVLKMKTTASPWASGVIKETGQPVPRRWHNLTWWDTLVTIHSTAHMGGNVRLSRCGIGSSSACSSWCLSLYHSLLERAGSLSPVRAGPLPRYTAYTCLLLSSRD